jgi:hypothetical protein
MIVNNIRAAQTLIQSIQEGMFKNDLTVTINQAQKYLNEAADNANKIPGVVLEQIAHSSMMAYHLPGEAERVSVSLEVFGSEAAINKLSELLHNSAMTMGIGDGSGKLFVHGDYDSIAQLRSILGQNEEQRRAINSMKAELERSRNRSVIDACQKAQKLSADVTISEMNSLVRWQSELDYGGEKLTIIHSDKFADGCYYVRHSFGDGSVAENIYPAYNHLGALLLAKNADLNYAVPLEWFS